jgi:hypothetical protein
LWLRWTLSLGVVLVLGVALVVFVEHNGPNSPTSTNPAAIERANQEAEILLEQDQVPHVVRLSARTAAAAALEQALRADMAHRIATAAIDGPLERTTCTPTGAKPTTRQAFRCAVVAAHVSYPFLAVVDIRSHRITYCKRDVAAVPSQDLPVSPRCLP